MDKVNAEQSFIITHNNMFSMYPVDVINLGKENIHEKYPLATEILVKKKL